LEDEQGYGDASDPGEMAASDRSSSGGNLEQTDLGERGAFRLAESPAPR